MQRRWPSFLSRWEGKFQRDVCWNLGSFAVSALAAVIINVLVGVTYGTAALGAFVQVFAIYTFFSQFSALGINYSVLQATAANADDRRTCATILAGAATPTLVLAAASAIVLWAGRGLIGDLVSSPAVSEGIAWAAPGLFLFGLNKVLQGMINGLSWMRSFASLGVIRSLLMIISFVVIRQAAWPAETIPLVLTVAEVGVFVVAVATLRSGGYFRGAKDSIWSWARHHLHFGLRSFAAAALTALNNWIDVLMLGHFVGDHEVGVYAIPAMVAAGFYQILVVLRNNYNPHLVTKYKANDLADLEKMIHRGKRLTYLAMLVAAALVLAIYPIAARALDAGGAFLDGWPILAILLCGIVAVAGYVPFNHILMLANRPGLHTWTIVLTVLVKVAANWALIPVFAAKGAALATAGCYVFNAALMIYLTRRLINVRL